MLVKSPKYIVHKIFVILQYCKKMARKEKAIYVEELLKKLKTVLQIGDHLFA